MRRPPLATAPLALACVLVLAACGGGDGGDDPGAAADAAAGDTAAEDTAAATVTPDSACERLTAVPADSMEAAESGLRVLQVETGQGTAASAGDTVAAHYLGCLTDGTKFDASRDRGEPISFVLGQGRVIQGWDEGLRGMQPGGVRYLRIPPDLGYGARGTPGGPIPPDATLLFEVEMVDVRPGGNGSGGG